ncbi:MAG: transporter, partial [Hyphomicrobiales bacterium]|nr:transporter [Hyphomicrobiales bacterium]
MGPRNLREPARRGSAKAKASGDKPVSSLQSLRRLLPFILRYPWRLALTLVFLLISALSSLIIPSLAGGVIDNGFTTKNLSMVTSYGWLIVAAAAVMGAAAGARFYFTSILGERILTDLRTSVFEHILTLDSVFFDTHRVGELTSRLNGDVGAIRNAIGSTLSMTLRGLITIAGAVTLMFITSPWMTLAIIFVAPMLIIPMIAVSKRLRPMSRRSTDALADMSAMSNEALGATRTIKSFVQEPVQSRAYGERAEDSYSAEVTRLMARSALVAVTMFVSTAALVVLVWWGAKSVFDGTVTGGQLAQFMIYALMATNALGSLSEIWGTLQTVAGSTERLVEILDTHPTLTPPANPLAFPEPTLGTVSFENVDFAYATRDNDTVLKQVSFTVNRGETVALVGESGAGKSTSFALVQRFYDVTNGSIKVDGLDVRSVVPAELRRRFAYVEQEPTIFAGTIADNIRFGRPDATDAEIQAASEAALVHGFVMELENGYDSIVG